jgi:predicted metal-dependent hydrolase
MQADTRNQLERGITLFNRGFYWEAHEAWELAWIPDRHGPDRGFYKGLIQVAAGCLHYTRQNRRGALTKWTSGTDFLRPYIPAHHGVDVASLVIAVDELRGELEAAPDWPRLPLPVISAAAASP